MFVCMPETVSMLAMRMTRGIHNNTLTAQRSHITLSPLARSYVCGWYAWRSMQQPEQMCVRVCVCVCGSLATDQDEDIIFYWVDGHVESSSSSYSYGYLEIKQRE